MKRILIIGVVTASIVLTAIFLVVPVFAQAPDSATPNADPSANPMANCPNVNQTSQNGDYQAMIEACQKISGAENMPCLEQDDANAVCPHQQTSDQSTSYGMMGGGMMSGGMMGNYSSGGMMGSSGNTFYR